MIRASNDKHKIFVFNLLKFVINYQNTGSAFYENNFYDAHYGRNTKELEIKFNEIIERPIVKLFDRICNSTEEITTQKKDYCR